MLKDVYKVLLSKVNQGNQCIMLTYLNLHNNRSGSIEEKILLTNFYVTY
ncbi:hypothetical protein CLHOM_23920 [Clostridium homopropionicum DSM 5847]|uniref:Uncharacterized protein n=1 Tax=Clostridium homopropionicum DSM 5847 TaxID=1121318 RepID=A0A0L6Z8I9_9CLOT|nr:hypothetical protein CLHOM_23920 [Clostridium homopropionicum DSM 5847]SFG19825.1 xanthine dehydrogenase accessory factor [Clostridium homopropionicum]